MTEHRDEIEVLLCELARITGLGRRVLVETLAAQIRASGRLLEPTTP